MSGAHDMRSFGHISVTISLENFKINHLNVHTIIARALSLSLYLSLTHHTQTHDDVVFLFRCYGSSSRLLTVILPVKMCTTMSDRKRGKENT